jgi:hypothetical protein
MWPTSFKSVVGRSTHSVRGGGGGAGLVKKHERSTGSPGLALRPISRCGSGVGDEWCSGANGRSGRGGALGKADSFIIKYPKSSRGDERIHKENDKQE